MKHIDLNSDMGESFGAYKIGDDKAMLDIVSSANIACGFHGGDPVVMFNAISNAKAKGVEVGAHPGYQDLYGFGRRVIKGDSLAYMEKSMIYQLGAFDGIARAAGHKMTYVKIHGALNNVAQEDDDLAFALTNAVKIYDKTLKFMVMPHLALERAAQKLNLDSVSEIFADRTYEANGNVTSRKIEGAVLHDAKFASQRVLEMLDTQTLTARDGTKLKAKIDSICVHSDEPSAVEMARVVKVALIKNGWMIKSFIK